MWPKTVWGWGWQEDIFSSFTTRTTSASPEATCHQPAMVVKTPVPPPTKARMYGLRAPPHPSRRFSPFMWMPSKASGAVPLRTASTSPRPIPAWSRAMRVAS